jgi:hypothetical protein
MTQSTFAAVVAFLCLALSGFAILQRAHPAFAAQSSSPTSKPVKPVVVSCANTIRVEKRSFFMHNLPSDFAED